MSDAIEVSRKRKERLEALRNLKEEKYVSSVNEDAILEDKDANSAEEDASSAEEVAISESYNEGTHSGDDVLTVDKQAEKFMKEALALGTLQKDLSLNPSSMIPQSFSHDYKIELKKRSKALENEKQAKIFELVRERLQAQQGK